MSGDITYIIVLAIAALTVSFVFAMVGAAKGIHRNLKNNKNKSI
jgi:hypothetical protein